jgi:hypothetical protein
MCAQKRDAKEYEEYVHEATEEIKKESKAGKEGRQEGGERDWRKIITERMKLNQTKTKTNKHSR